MRLRTRLWARLPLADALARADGDTDSRSNSLVRALGRRDLVLLGVTLIVGGGIFVVTGNAAADYAGPAIILSFLIAGAGCFLAALCYAELAAMIPVAGSAYTYCYVAFGELPAWIIAWCLTTEYVFAAAYVAVGWSGYVTSLLRHLSIPVSPDWANAPLSVQDQSLAWTGAALNLPAVSIVLIAAAVAFLGVRLSSILTSWIAVAKIAVLALIIVCSLPYLHPANWHPFIPPNTGVVGQFGFTGIVRGALVVFVAYLGFDAIATAAQETQDPGRTLPGAMLICLGAVSTLYIGVAAVMTGLIHYRALSVPNPLSVALASAGPGLAWLIPIVEVTAAVGLAVVVLALLTAQSRVLFAMSCDRLMPRRLAYLHPRFHTPVWAILLCAVLVAGLAGAFPIDTLVKMVSIGTLTSFTVVSLGVLVLRRTQPAALRPFRVPLVPLVPLLSTAICGYLLFSAPAQTLRLYAVWLVIAVISYLLGLGMRRLSQRNTTAAQDFPP